MTYDPKDLLKVTGKTKLVLVNTHKQGTYGPIVLTCGYTHGGMPGYFVVEDISTEDEVDYTNQHYFVPLSTPRAYETALHYLRTLVE